MGRKNSSGLIKILSIIGLIVSVVSLAAAIVYYWDAITNAVRQAFPNLPKINLFGKNACCDKTAADDFPSEFDDFADV